MVEPDQERAMLIVDSLSAAGPHEIHVIAEFTGLARAVTAHNSDVVLVDVLSPSRDMIEELSLASGPMERPVAMFVDQTAGGMTKAAIEAGVSAYVVDGLRPDRIKPIMDAAIARFHMFQRMRTELETTKQALEERKVIDRAKGLLMKHRECDEAAAFGAMRKMAMNKKVRLVEIAQDILVLFDE